MKSLLIATGNPGKVRELQALLTGLPLKLVTPRDLGLTQDVAEDGHTYLENARKKALAWCAASGLPTLADDSGLEVDALGGAPGIYSARYAPQPGADDAARRAYLLEQLRPYPRPWTARFVAVTVLALPGGALRWTRGECPGEITSTERGQNGFGYDPIFLLPELGKTMAELTPEEKNRLSHRARAMLAMRPILQEMLF